MVETLGEKRTKDGATRERELYKAAAAQGLLYTRTRRRRSREARPAAAR